MTLRSSEKMLPMKNFRFRREIVPQLLVESGEQYRVGHDLIEIGEVQPLHARSW